MPQGDAHAALSQSSLSVQRENLCGGLARLHKRFRRDLEMSG
jgi:hypothetical protein